MNSNFVIQVDGRTYTAEDIAEGKHKNDPAITDADGTVTNVCHGEATGIQAGSITGGITFY